MCPLDVPEIMTAQIIHQRRPGESSAESEYIKATNKTLLRVLTLSLAEHS